MAVRLTQQVAEAQAQADDSELRLTQQVAEVQAQSNVPGLRDTQIVVEVLTRQHQLARIREVFLMSTGKTYKKQEGTVYLKKHDTLNPFIWGGRCMRVEDIASNEGGLTVTQCQDPRGGLARDSVILGAPAETTTQLVMKRQQFDTMKTELRKCLWDIDMRMHCGGIDRDAFNKWEEITRICGAKITTRTMTGTLFDGDDEEQMVTADITAFDTTDLYRIGGSADTAVLVAANGMIMDVVTAQPERCPDVCDDQEDCVVYAVTEAITGSPSASPFFLYNLYGGEPGQWNQISVTEFGANDIESVIGFGEFAVMSSNGGGSIVYTDDRGTTRVEVILASSPAASPHALDGIDQTYLLVGCDNGDIYQSVDSARNWTLIADGLDSGNSMDIVKICRDNPQVIYAASNSSDEIQKSENGGETWFQVAANAAGGSNILSLYPITQNQILIGTDNGEVFESLDGGETWTEQNSLPGATTKANVNVNDITGCGCGVLFLAVFESAVGSRVYRNVDGGADGRWYVPADAPNPLSGVANELKAIACCDANRAIAVGGQADTADVALLLA